MAGLACGPLAAFAFHPEVTADPRLISRFLSACGNR